MNYNGEKNLNLRFTENNSPKLNQFQVATVIRLYIPLMKYSSFLLILLMPLLLVFCTDDYKTLDLKAFKITVPKHWNYEIKTGMEPFLGELKTNKNFFDFSYSEKGEISSGPRTEKEFLKDFERYSTDDINGIPVSSPSNRIFKPSPQQKAKYPRADYLMEIKRKDSVIIGEIMFPKDVKRHHIRIDTVGEYILRTVWPKTVSLGTTGIYIQSRVSKLRFNLAGFNLPQRDQDDALKAFKTIVFKH